MIHFLRPEWLLALIPLGLLLLVWHRYEQRQSSWNHYIAPHLAQVLVSKIASTKKINRHTLTFCWLITILALSGPALSQQNIPIFGTSQGRVIVMDMSQSMYATDLPPNRFTQEKFKAIDLIKSLTEGETALVAYAGEAFTISPLTRDSATLLNLLPTLSPQIMPVKGSNLTAALKQAKKLLHQGGHLKGDIVLLTDDIESTEVDQAKAILNGSEYRLSIIAFGSRQGAAIRLPRGQLLRDNNQKVVIAKTDYALLRQLANDNRGHLYPYRADGSDLKQLRQWLKHNESTKTSRQSQKIWQDLGPYIALLLLLPALLNFRYTVAVLALLVLYGQPNPVYANSWRHPWKTDNQRAMQAYNHQDYAQAAQLFDDPNWKAAALYKKGAYKKALALFGQNKSATGLYNQANSLMKLKDYKKAIDKYQQALALNNHLEDAKANLELAKKLMAQRKRQSGGQQGKKGSKSSKDSKDSKNSKGSKGSKGSKDDKKSNGSKASKNSQDSNSSQTANGSKDSKEAQNAKGTQQSTSQKSKPDGTKNKQPSSPQDLASNARKNNDAKMEANADAKSHKDNKPAPSLNEKVAKDQQSIGKNAQKQKANTARDNTNNSSNRKRQQKLPAQMQRALTSVVDDPQVLLRNKMQLEYQRRVNRGEISKDGNQW